MANRPPHKETARHHFLRERQLTLLGGGLILLVLLVAFAVLIVSVNRIMRRTVSVLNAQADTVAGQTTSLLNNYARLCETLIANQNLLDFAAHPAEESEETLTVAGYPLRKDLNSLVALYGSDINTLAVYFPGNGSVITMSRQLVEEDNHLFFDAYPSLSPSVLQQIPLGQNWLLHFAAEDDAHNYIVRRISQHGDSLGYVIVEYGLSGFVERVAPDGACTIIYQNGEPVYSNLEIPATAALLEHAQNGRRFQLGGNTYVASWQQPRLYGLDVLVGVSTDQLSHIRATLLTVTILAAFLVACSLGVLGFWLNRQLFTPVEQLLATSSRQNGDTSKAIHSIQTDLSEIRLANDSLQRERDSILPLALGRQLERMLQANDGEEVALNAQSCLLLAGLHSDEGFAMFAVCCAQDRGGFFAKMGQDPRLHSQEGLFHYLLNNVLDDLLFQDYPGTVAPFQNNWFLVIVSCGSAADVEQVETVAQTLLDTYERTFDTALLTTRTYQGTNAQEFNKAVHSVFQEASYLDFWGGEPEEGGEAADSFPPYRQLVRKLFARLNLQDYDSIPDLLDSLFDQLLPGDMARIQLTRHRIYALAALILTGIDDQLNGDTEFAVSHHFEERLYRAKNIADFKKELGEILNELSDYKKSRLPAGPNRMEEIKQYILAHYTENDLTAASVAATFQMSGSYLSRTFKDYTGSNILDYIQRLRVDAAKDLLRTESVKNTAQRVGFWDTQGLVRAFKKHEGVTPSEYKRIQSLPLEGTATKDTETEKKL